MFSGGETRAGTGPETEGASYYRVADAMKLWPSESTVRARSLTEEFATDSFENLYVFYLFIQTLVTMVRTHPFFFTYFPSDSFLFVAFTKSPKHIHKRLQSFPFHLNKNDLNHSMHSMHYDGHWIVLLLLVLIHPLRALALI